MIPRGEREFVDCPLRFTREDGVSGDGRVFNISIAGCAVRSATRVTEGMYVSLIIDLPGEGPPVWIELARTRWATSEEFGVQFVMLSQKDRRALLRWLVAAASQRSGQR